MSADSDHAFLREIGIGGEPPSLTCSYDGVDLSDYIKAAEIILAQPTILDIPRAYLGRDGKVWFGCATALIRRLPNAGR